MRTISKNYSKLLLAVIVTGSILVTDTGCKTKKAVTKTNTDDSQAKADADARKKAAADAAAKAAAAAAAQREPYNRVENYFQQIANAGSASNANPIISNALQSFSSGDVPVLIIIYRSGSTVDYDKPTTISNYLNFIKDQKQSPNSVDHLDMDSNGKITQVVLIKK